MSTARTTTAATAASPPPQATGYGATSYFPHQQSQQQQQQIYQNPPADVETLSNTRANSQPDYGDHLIAPIATRPAKFTEEWDASQRGTSIIESPATGTSMQRSVSGPVNGATGDGTTSLSRGNTLKKRTSVRRSVSLKRSSSRRSMNAGSVRSLVLQSTTDQDEMQSAFYCPVPTTGSPTEVLANRFQAWRKILKDLITFFREIQTHYEHRAKSLLKLSTVLNNTATPPGFLASGGVEDALQALRNYNKLAILEANKAKEIEEDVVLALTGLRSDLHQKIKEIKNLSGDFKNSVEKEMDTTRRAVNQLQEVLGQAELDPGLTTGKQDPYLLRLAVDRQLERQIDEENYLHQAYLNLEHSGRELESIVVGEIQKAYNAYAGILKREADAAYGAIEELRDGPISMPKDREWVTFIQRDDQFVDPDLAMRSAQFIHYPGRDHHACQEIRAGLLERKSKYLKSYTPGWYVLSPTHLHEYKSADKTQAPVMSLYLPEQKLGSHSTEGSSSNKFVLKGRQTGPMHRGHTWVFRAESHDTMMAWYDDIKTLTERTPEERGNLVRALNRSISRASQRSSLSSDGGVDDDEEPPFRATVASVGDQPRQDPLSRRPSGGRFPSDLQVNAQRGLQVPVSPLSVSSTGPDESLNHGYFAAPPERDSGRDPQSPDEFSRARGTERDSYPRQTHLDGYHVAPAQRPFPESQPNEAAATSPQRQTFQEFGPASNPSMSPVNASRDRPVWAEPVPVPLPILRPEARLSPPPGSAAHDLQHTTMANGRGPSIIEPRAQGGDGGRARSHLNGNAVGSQETIRQDGSVPGQNVTTPSHLHIPGEYPRPSNAGF